MDSVTIRRLGVGDEQLAIDAIGALKIRPEHSRVSPSAEHIEKLLADDTNHLYLALDQDRPVGFLVAHRFPRIDRDQEMVYLYEIDVLPQFRRRRIGSRLVEALLRDCTTAGAVKIWVGTGVDNVSARRLFESTGAELARETYAEYVYILD